MPGSGIGGAIAALLLAQFTRLALYLIVSQRLLPLPYPSGSLIGLAALTVSLLLAGESVQGPVAQSALAVVGTIIMLAAVWVLRLIPVNALQRVA